MNQLSLSEAKRLSIIKWEYIVENGGDYIWRDSLPKEVQNLKYSCGFCERWKNDDYEFETNCDQCEFRKLAGQCQYEGSLYNLWEVSRGGDDQITLLLAQQILGTIKSIQVEKFEPCGKAYNQPNNPETKNQ